MFSSHARAYTTKLSLTRNRCPRSVPPSPWQPPPQTPPPQALPLLWRGGVHSAVGVEHAAGAGAAEEAALAGGARVAADGRWWLAAVAGGHAGRRHRGPGPHRLLHRSFFLQGKRPGYPKRPRTPTRLHLRLGTPTPLEASHWTCPPSQGQLSKSLRASPSPVSLPLSSEFIWC